MAEALRQSVERYRVIAENSRDVIWLVELPSMLLRYVNPSVERLRGWTPQELIGQPMTATMPPETEQNVRAIAARLLERLASNGPSDLHETVELEMPSKDGRQVPVEVVATLLLDEAGQPQHVLGISRDITERKANEEAIRQLAFFDRLTQLPNRRLLEDRLQQSIARAQRERRRLSLLFIDLDKFKPINDAFGHEAGDWLLQRVAERMKDCLRQSDTVARIGGDEFIVLLPDTDSVQAATHVAEKIRAALERPFFTDAKQSLQISSSIGVVLYPEHADNARDLLRFGDEAMYRAKKSGRNAVEVFASASPEAAAQSQAQEREPAARLPWQSGYAVGEPTIDGEHRELFRLLNRLLDLAARPDVDRARLNEAFEALLARAASHFAHEEKILAAHGYDAKEQHARLHAELLEHVRELQRECEAGTLPMGELIEFLAVELVVGHMLGSDNRLAGQFEASKPAA